MKKLLLVSLCFLSLFVTQVYAQNRTITGTVTSKDDGLPLPSVSVAVPGTTIGTQTSEYGKFTIKVPESAKSLSISFIGYKTRVIQLGSGSVINVVLESNANQLTEVVVTSAFGIKQTSRSASNSAQVVTGTELNTVRQPNINNALAGKVAGIQVRSQSAGNLGRATEVRLRGASGFGAGSGALYVVDGTILPSADDLNADDIESVTVLQGAAAAALLGSQGANGAIVITTTKAKKSQGLGIDLRLGATFDKAYLLPRYQDTYAGGASSTLQQYVWKTGDPEEWKALSGKYYHDYSDDSSWGPKMTGQEYIPWYAWYGGSKYSYKTASLTPQPDNARSFFRTAALYNNSVTFNKAGDDYNFKLSYGNIYQNGIIPTQNLKKNTLNLNYSYDLSKHFNLSASLNYVNQKIHGDRNQDGYANNTAGGFTQWFHRDLDMGIMKELQNLQFGDRQYASWNHANPNSYNPANPLAFYGGNYWYNYYTYQNLLERYNNRDRFYGNVTFTYKVNNDLNFKATYRKQQLTTWTQDITPTELERSAVQTGIKASYYTQNTYANRENVEFQGNYSKKIKDFGIDANVGTDMFRYQYKDNSVQTNTTLGLLIPYLYTVNNGAGPATMVNNRIREAYNAAYGNLTLNWRQLLFVNGSLRKDWYSTLPANNNSVLSKSLGGSFVFGDLIKESAPWLSYGKVRYSYGQIPKALGTTNETFGAYRYPGLAYGVSTNTFNGQLLQQTPDAYVDPSIHGSVVTASEAGIDLRFLNDRIGLSGTYFWGSEKDIPQTISVNGASGFSQILTNFGLVTKKGIDITANGYPVRLPNFSWNVSLTYENLISNKVVTISPKYGVSQINVGGLAFSNLPSLVQKEGMAWGQLFGPGILRNAAGVPVLDANGFYQRNSSVYFGSVLPKHTGGMQNTFSIYKDFAVNINIDYQFGGKFASLSNAFGAFSGVTYRTAVLNDKGNPVRDAVADGGGVHMKGVNAAGQPVDTYVEAYDYYHNNWNNGANDEFIYDLSFVKLREVGVSYRLPIKKWGITAIKNATLQLQAHDLWLIYAKTKDFDPSQISAVVGENGQLPGTRGIGFNLRVGF